MLPIHTYRDICSWNLNRRQGFRSRPHLDIDVQHPQPLHLVLPTDPETMEDRHRKGSVPLGLGKSFFPPRCRCLEGKLQVLISDRLSVNRFRQYAIHSHPALHSAVLSPVQIEEAIVPLSPRPGEDHLRTQDILDRLDELGDEVAVVWIGCVQYYTGQFFEVEPIASKTHEIVSRRAAGEMGPTVVAVLEVKQILIILSVARAHTLGSTWRTLSATCPSSSTIGA